MIEVKNLTKRYGTHCAVNNISFQVEEVSELKWAGREEVFQMLSDGRFVDYAPELMERIFDAI